MRNINEARDYVQHIRKEVKKLANSNQFSEEQFVTPTYMMLLTTEAQEKYLGNNKYYRQAIDEVFDEYMNILLSHAEKKMFKINIHENVYYEQMHQFLRMYQMIDRDDDLYDGISIVNAIKTLVNMKMIHKRWIDVAIKYSQEEKVKMLCFGPLNQ